MPLEIACKKVGVPVDKLESWERGDTLPTMVQAETLANAYRRPFAVLFLPRIPRDFTLLHDFRAKTASPLGTGAIFIMREIQQKQAWLRELYEENEEAPLPFVGRYSPSANPQEVAADILATLEVNPSHYTASSPLREWIRKTESKRICISRISFIHSKLKLDSEEFQGFVIADKLAPFIFVNSDDWEAPQLFTLVHELAHIWIAQSGVTDVPGSGLSAKKQLDPTELFCNEVAASALMPATIMLSAKETLNNYGEIKKLALRLGVSTLALLIRAFKLNLVSLAMYHKYKSQADTEFHAYEQQQAILKSQRKKATGKGPNYYTMQLSKNGRLFTQIVIDAFNGGAVAPTQASSLLNTQVNKFSVYENMLSR